MTLEIGILFALLAAMVALFLTEKLPVDLTAFLGLSVLVAGGFVESTEAFEGFASPAVITMLSVFFVSAGLQYTGVAGAIGGRIHRVVGSREVPLIVAIMLVSGGLSAFMNNIAAAAVLMPAVVSLARQAGVSPSRLLMPLAFGSILGGTTTLVGTPPNLLVGEVLSERGLEPFGLFDFAPFGLALLGAGVLFMVTIGRRLLPKGGAGMAETAREDLTRVYALEERLFGIRIPEGSPLAGCSLSDSRFNTVLGVQVVSIHRDGSEQLAPEGSEILRPGDLLVVEGLRSDLEGRLGLQDAEVEGLGSVNLEAACDHVCGAVIRLRKDSLFVGRSLRELRMRERHRVTVAGCWRDGEAIGDGLSDIALLPGDELLAIGETHWVDQLVTRADLDLIQEGASTLHRIEAGLFMLRVPDGSSFAGRTVRETQLGEHFDLTVVGVLRGEATELIMASETRIEAGDALLVTGPATKIGQVLQMGHVEVSAATIPRSELESDDVGLLEVVVAPRSSAVGRSLRALAFRKRYGLRALAIWRGDRPIRTGLVDLPLKLGDGLLLHGRRDKAALLRNDPDFVVLSGGSDTPLRTAKAPFALGSLLLMVILVVTGLFPIQVAAFFAATLVVLTRALKMREAYEAVEWRAIFLVAAILPVGVAMERTGAAQLLADSVAGAAGGLGPYAVLIALMVLSSLLSQGLDGAPTVVILGPVVVGTAAQLGLSPYPLMMGVGLAASAAFMTPFSHKANLLVMGAGGYRAMDYVRVGTPLTVVVLAILAVMIPLLMPFYP